MSSSCTDFNDIHIELNYKLLLLFTFEVYNIIGVYN